jgi:hypothetical protein
MHHRMGKIFDANPSPMTTSLALARLERRPRSKLEHTFYPCGVGVNPPKHDTWPEPKAWLHVWVRRRRENYPPPMPGLVLDWRRRGQSGRPG